MPEASDNGGVAGPLLVEALRLAADASFDSADHPSVPLLPEDAVERGWTPLGTAELGPMPGLADGVQRLALAEVPDPGDPGRTVAITSAAHVYEGVLEGERTVAVAFRGTDEGPAEFAFQAAPSPDGTTIGWDLYQRAHAPLVDAALAYAEASGAARVLLTGHSLGGAVAELSAQRGLPGSGLEDRAVTLTYGNPGPEAPARPDEGANGLSILNLVHSDDLIPLLGERSPLLAFLGREGEDVLVDRPEGSLAGLGPLDTEAALLAATTAEPANLVEHAIGLYLDTASALTANERVVPGAGGGDALDRRLGAEVDRVAIGGGGDDRLVGGRGGDVLIGRGGDDALRGLGGDDGLAGGPGNDLLDGGRGHNRVAGGGGVDVAVFRGSVDDYSTTGSLAGRLLVTSDDGGTRTLLSGVEIVQFGDAILEIA